MSTNRTGRAPSKLQEEARQRAAQARADATPLKHPIVCASWDGKRDAHVVTHKGGVSGFWLTKCGKLLANPQHLSTRDVAWIGDEFRTRCAGCCDSNGWSDALADVRAGEVELAADRQAQELARQIAREDEDRAVRTLLGAALAALGIKPDKIGYMRDGMAAQVTVGRTTILIRLGSLEDQN